jgi:hypothetical protein
LSNFVIVRIDSVSTGIVLVDYTGRRERNRLPSHAFDEEDATDMTADVLTFPTTLDEPAPAAGVWIRRVLLFLLVAAGAVTTLWILSHLGPVVYGLPAPFMRRARAVASAF